MRLRLFSLCLVDCKCFVINKSKFHIGNVSFVSVTIFYSFLCLVISVLQIIREGNFLKQLWLFFHNKNQYQITFTEKVITVCQSSKHRCDSPGNFEFTTLYNLNLQFRVFCSLKKQQINQRKQRAVSFIQRGTTNSHQQVYQPGEAHFAKNLHMTC